MKFIMEMVSNHSFTLHTNDGQHSRLRRLRNGVPQGSVLAQMSFNIYIHDLPNTESKKYRYADDLAILLSNPSWSRVERGLSHDMTALSSHLRNRRLMLSVPKTMSASVRATETTPSDSACDKAGQIKDIKKLIIRK